MRTGTMKRLAARALAALAAVLLPASLTRAHEGLNEHTHAPADGTAVTQNVRTGSGGNTYQSVANWCQIPEDRKAEGKLGPTHGGIVVDKAGNIYFSMDGGGPHGILVYSPDGKFIR